MEAPTPTTNISLKIVPIDFENKKFNCKIQIIKNFLVISFDSSFIYEGYIHLSEIRSLITAFSDYNINEIFEEINLLDIWNFSMVREQDKYKLKIKFIICRKEQF